MEQTVEAVIADLQARVKTLEGQVSDLFNRARASETQLSGIAQKLDDMLVTLGEVKNAVSQMQQQPSKRWEHIIQAAITAVVAAAVGFAVAKFK